MVDIGGEEVGHLGLDGGPVDLENGLQVLQLGGDIEGVILDFGELLGDEGVGKGLPADGEAE